MTGASGFIGRFLVEELIERGYTVIAVGRTPSPFRDHPRLRYHQADLIEHNVISRLLTENKPEAVIHLAALLADACEIDPNTCFELNLVATYNLIRYSVLTKVRKFLFSSSSAVYNPDVLEPVKEEYAGTPTLFYGIMKYSCELIGLWYDRKGLIDFRVLRPTVVFGPGRIRGPSAEYSSYIIDKALKGELVVVKSPEMKVNYVYVRDVVNAYIALLETENANSKIYNVGGFMCKVIDFVNMVKKYIPTLRYEISPIPAVKYPANVDISKAKTELGWSPRYLYDKAIEDYIETVKHGSKLFKL